MEFWGAFAFGTVIGWFTYFTNRYRKGDVQFADIATLLGVIGGGAVTALFGDGKTALFAAYGLGLAFGFFAYFAALIVMVRKSGGVFSLTWFLDGRRKKLADDEEIPIDTRPTLAPMAVQPVVLGSPAPGAAQSTAGMFAAEQVAALGMPADSATAFAAMMAQRDIAISAANEGIRELLRRIGDTADDDERARLRQAHRALSEQFDTLVALRLKLIMDSDAVTDALANLGEITSGMKQGAAEMKQAAAAVASAAKMIDLAAKVVQLLAVFAV
jgi:hypothetical protein